MTAGRTNVNQKSRSWCTPPKYADAVSKFFGGDIELDPCSNEHSLIRSRVAFCLPEHDGLKEDWNFSTIYVNPPYGADRERGTTIRDWLKKCCLAHEQHGAEVLALVPVATNTGHWKKHVFGKASGICFLYDTRLKFWIDGKCDDKGAPMSCAMIYWGNNPARFVDVFAKFGAALDTTALKETFDAKERPDLLVSA